MNPPTIDTEIKRIITTTTNKFVVFHLPNCPWCQRALTLLQSKQKNIRSFRIGQELMPDLQTLLASLQRLSAAGEIDFDTAHRTVPIVFYNGEFIGGYNRLAEML